MMATMALCDLIEINLIPIGDGNCVGCAKHANLAIEINLIPIGDGNT